MLGSLDILVRLPESNAEGARLHTYEVTKFGLEPFIANAKKKWGVEPLWICEHVQHVNSSGKHPTILASELIVGDKRRVTFGGESKIVGIHDISRQFLCFDIEENLKTYPMGLRVKKSRRVAVTSATYDAYVVRCKAQGKG